MLYHPLPKCLQFLKSLSWNNRRLDLPRGDSRTPNLKIVTWRKFNLRIAQGGPIEKDVGMTPFNVRTFLIASGIALNLGWGPRIAMNTRDKGLK